MSSIISVTDNNWYPLTTASVANAWFQTSTPGKFEIAIAASTPAAGDAGMEVTQKDTFISAPVLSWYRKVGGGVAQARVSTW